MSLFIVLLLRFSPVRYIKFVFIALTLGLKSKFGDQKVWIVSQQIYSFVLETVWVNIKARESIHNPLDFLKNIQCFCILNYHKKQAHKISGSSPWS